MIVPMKKVRLTFLKSEKEAILKSIQRGAHLMIIDTDDSITEHGTEVDQTLLETQESEAMLRLINNYSKHSTFFEPKPEISYNEFLDYIDGDDLLKDIEGVSTAYQAAQSEIKALEAENQTLRPWSGVDSPLSEVKDSKYVVVQPGFLQPENQQKIIDYINEQGQDIQVLDTVPEGTACIVYLFKAGSEEILTGLKELGFIETSVPSTDRPPLQIIRDNNKKIEVERENLNELTEKLKDFGSLREKLELYIQQLVSKSERQKAPFTETSQTVTIEGWVRSDRVRQFTNNVSSVTDFYDLILTDPEKGETPPTVTKNNYFLAQFETITDSYSLPKAGTLDPAPVAGPWYWLIFGMMIGDAGYGLVMAVALYIFRKIKKPQGNFGKLVNVLYYSSYTTIFWGILFGSYFGETFHPILFNPLDAPIYMLVLSIIIGALQMFSGMILKWVQDTKEGHFWDGVFDEFSWIIIISGIGLLFIPITRIVGIAMVTVGALTVLFTAGRDKPTILGKIGGGLLGLYDVTSYLSDILSYSRILALGLATSVVGMVMNLLAGMISTNFFGFLAGLLVLAIGHIFNIALSMLSAYVHDSRLQYIEFFNKFYEGGGLPFTPIEIDQRYIDVKGVNYSQGSDAVTGDYE